MSRCVLSMCPRECFLETRLSCSPDPHAGLDIAHWRPGDRLPACSADLQCKPRGGHCGASRHLRSGAQRPGVSAAKRWGAARVADASACPGSLLSDDACSTYAHVAVSGYEQGHER